MRRRWLLVAISLLAAFLRLYHLGAVDLRGDEAFAVVFSALPLREMFVGLARTEPNPPLYWLLLRWWQAVAGRGEFAVRLPSALAGVAAVTLTYRLGRMIGPRTSTLGPLALFLAAINPFLIWHSQDARVYSLLVALAAAATWLTLDRRTFQRFGLRTALAIALWWLALFAHYFAALALAGAMAAVLASPASRRHWRIIFASLAALGLAYLPWALYVAPLMLGHTKAWITPTSLSGVFARTIVAFVGGTTLTDSQRIFAGIVVGVSIVVTVVAVIQTQLATRNAQFTIRNSQFASRLFPLPTYQLPLLALLPPLLLGLLSLWRPAFDERFLIGSLPPFLILIALPLAHKWPGRRWPSWIGLGLLTTLATLSLANYYLLPAFRKSPAWRDFTTYLADSISPDDVILHDLNDPAFGYYYHGPASVQPPIPTPQSSIEARLTSLLDAYPRLWLILTDSTVPAGDWLNEHAERLSDNRLYGFRLQVFDSPAGSLAAMTPVDVEFADGIRLAGYRVYRADLTGRRNIHLTLYWQTDTRVQADYTVFTHLIAADGFQVAGHDSPPARGRRATSGWRSGEIIVDPHDLALPSDLAPGEYRLEVGLYDPVSLTRLPVVDSGVPPASNDSAILPSSLTVSP